MNRRTFIITTISIADFAMATANLKGVNATYLRSTKYIDCDSLEIVKLANSLAVSSTTPTDTAIRIHNFVRDNVRFGFGSGFYDQKASMVLELGVGFCNTKGTLFIALLRAAGIPARQHFVDINASILTPFVDPGTELVDHSYTEVFLEEQWHKVDSYIVDAKLFSNAKKRLLVERKTIGYGIHRNGDFTWDGQSNRFSQFVDDKIFSRLTTKDYGVFEDVGAFYESGNGVNKLNFLVRAGFGLFTRSINQRIEAVRNES